jgi:hypothetical protein
VRAVCYSDASALLCLNVSDFLLYFRRLCKIEGNGCQLRHFCPSVRVEQLGSHWTDFDETWYFRKSVEKIKVLLKSDKNNGYFT